MALNARTAPTAAITAIITIAMTASSVELDKPSDLLFADSGELDEFGEVLVGACKNWSCGSFSRWTWSGNR